jgi:hypothetical protein
VIKERVFKWQQMYSKYRELTARLCEIFTSLDVTFDGKLKKSFFGAKDSLHISAETCLLLLT